MSDPNKPYNEADDPRKSVTIKSRAKPIEDRLRNGVEILDDIHVMRGTWQSTATSLDTLGQLSSDLSGSFTDGTAFDAAHFVRSPKTDHNRVSVDDKFKLGDGYIEPLTIRRDLANTGVTELELPFIFRSVKGQLMGSTEDRFLHTQMIEQFVETKIMPVHPFLDAGDDFGDDQKGKNLPILTKRWLTQKSGSAHDETLYVRRGAKVSDNFDSGIRSGVLSMDPSSDSFLPSGKKSSPAGFYIDENSFGTDSIAFLR